MGLRKRLWTKRGLGCRGADGTNFFAPNRSFFVLAHACWRLVCRMSFHFIVPSIIFDRRLDVELASRCAERLSRKNAIVACENSKIRSFL
jgi:hypothetical protein